MSYQPADEYDQINHDLSLLEGSSRLRDRLEDLRINDRDDETEEEEEPSKADLS